MIWIPNRDKYKGGRLNRVLAFKYLVFQLIKPEQFDGWVIDLIPGIAIARNAWIVLGLELSWFNYGLSISIPTETFNNAIVEELKWYKEWLERQEKDAH